VKGKHVVLSDVHSRELVGCRSPRMKEVQNSAHRNIATRTIGAWRNLPKNYSWELFILSEVENREVSGAEGLPHQDLVKVGLNAPGGGDSDDPSEGSSRTNSPCRGKT